MTSDQLFEVTKSLGIAAPLVVVLLYLLRLLIELLAKATDERQTITAQFVDAMKTTATTSAVAQPTTPPPMTTASQCSTSVRSNGVTFFDGGPRRAPFDRLGSNRRHA